MKKIIFSLFVSIFLVSCEKYPEPSNEVLEYFYFYILGNNQTGKGGEYLVQDIGAQIDFNSIVPAGNKGFRLEIEVSDGNGSVDDTSVTADETGKMSTRWKLGNDKNDQILSCRILDASDKVYKEFTINATAFLTDKLNTIKSGFLVGIQDMVSDTVNHRSMMLSWGNLYVNNGDFYSWKQADYPPVQISGIEINSKQELFAAGYNGELLRSIDWGNNWYSLGKVIPGDNYAFDLSISDDDYIWVTKWGYGVYCSKDNGLTWTKDTVGLDDQEALGRVFCFSDTSHVALSQSRSVVLKTDDDGISWSPINSPQFLSTIYVTNDNALITQASGGFILYKSTDSGENYKKVFQPAVAIITTSSHCYDKFKEDYYVLAPGGGVWKTKDFEDFEQLMTFNLQRNLFIDHKGNIYAAGYNYANAEDEPTLILPNNE